MASCRGARTVKLMCSFGGRIAVRPGDGVLRYVRGQTRLVSVPRAASFGAFLRKVEAVDEAAAAGVLVVKYQLPGEDLDTLISVSSTEDYDNMMECDKLAAAARVGSAAKLRVFLFRVSESEAAACSGFHLAARVVDESGQRCIDNVSCLSKDSAGSSAHNSSVSEYSGLAGGRMSPPAVPPPPSLPSEYSYSGGVHYQNASPESVSFSVVTVPAPAMGIPAQNHIYARTQQPHQAAAAASYGTPPQQPTQVATYVPQQQHQAYPYLQRVPQSVNFVPVQMSQFVPSTPVRPVCAGVDPVLGIMHCTTFRLCTLFVL